MEGTSINNIKNQNHVVDGSGSDESLDSVLDSLPKEKRAIIVSALSVRQKAFSGPLPAPEDFAEYEKVLPGVTDRIVSMAEKQSDHRISSETKIINGKLRQSGFGQILGAILVFTFGLIALILGLNGHDILAGSIGVTTVISIAVVFVLNREPSSHSVENKDAQ